MAGSDDNGDDGSTVASVGEFGLIDAVTSRLPGGAAVRLGPGDDAAVVTAPGGTVVVTTDLLVEGVHFRRDWSGPEDVGHKAAAQNLADLAAMGARGTALVVGLATPSDLPLSWALGLADGLGAEAARVGAAVVGGDVVSSDRLVVAVTALGSLDGRDPVTRAGARVGDVVAFAGRLGWSAAGYAVLSRGFRSPRALVAAHRRPEPPYGEGPRAAEHGASAMVDVSDGLVADLGHLAAASGVRVDLRSPDLHVDAPVRDAAAALGRDPMDWVLGGGEDHALVATFPDLSAVPERWCVIGVVEEGAGVSLDGRSYEGPEGWRHLAPG